MIIQVNKFTPERSCQCLPLYSMAEYSISHIFLVTSHSSGVISDLSEQKAVLIISLTQLITSLLFEVFKYCLLIVLSQHEASLGYNYCNKYDIF